MNIKNSCLYKIRKEEKNDKTKFSEDSSFDNLFRKTKNTFYNDINREAVLLLGKGSSLVTYSKITENRIKSGKLRRKEMQKLDDVLNNADLIDSLKKRVYNLDCQNIKEKLCKYVDPNNFEGDKDKENKILKEKYTVLKREHDDLLANIDTKINLELIKAGVFYNKNDAKNILNFVRKQQTKLDVKNGIVNEQNHIIETIINYNKLNKKQLLISQKKIQKLTKMCQHYFEENMKTKKNFKNVQKMFTEYKIALENVVHCCEQIGGDKIALMDGIKTARAQADLSAATTLVKIKQIEELQTNMTYCKQKIEQLELNLKQQMNNLAAESENKRQAQMQVEIIKNELTENNNLLEKVFHNFHEIVSDLDTLINNATNKNMAKNMFDKKKDKYNEILKEVSKNLKLTHIKKERDKSETKDLMMSTSIEKQKNYSMQQQLEKEQRKKEEEEEEEAKRKLMEGGSFVKKMDQLKRIMANMNMNRITYDNCVDVIYKLDLPLTEQKLNELKSKKELTKEELKNFISSLLQKEEEILDNMIAFFEIWDVRKSGYMNKDLFVYILKEFGDKFSDEEATFLRKEMNVTSGPNVCYVDILKKWIHGEEKQ